MGLLYDHGTTPRGRVRGDSTEGNAHAGGRGGSTDDISRSVQNAGGGTLNAEVRGGGSELRRGRGQ